MIDLINKMNDQGYIVILMISTYHNSHNSVVQISPEIKRYKIKYLEFMATEFHYKCN